MGKIERVELTNMCMICDGTRVLVQDRQKSWRGVTFPGGHVEKGESFVDSVVREVKEETGLEISNVRLCGIKQYIPPAGAKDYDRYIVLLYRTNTFAGQLQSSDEGRVFWIEREELKNHQLPHGFEWMVDVFEHEELSENYWSHVDGELQVQNK